MIYGIGTDLLRIDRVERLWGKYGEHFADKILMPEERAQFEQARRKGNFLAKCFAAKEAFVKALRAPAGMSWQDIEVVLDEHGAPHLSLSGAAEARVADLGITRVHVSLSHDTSVATAFVVAES